MICLGAAASAKDFTDKLSALNSRMSEVVNILTDRNASASQVYIASRQMQLADRMGGRVGRIISGGEDSQAVAPGGAIQGGPSRVSSPPWPSPSGSPATPRCRWPRARTSSRRRRA